MTNSLILTLSLLVPQDEATRPPAAPLPSGVWQAWLDSPGGELSFRLEIQTTKGKHQAWLINDRERTAASSVTVVGDTAAFAWTDFDSTLQATITAGGMALDGTWEKQRDGTQRQKLDFHARFGNGAFGPPPMPLVAPSGPAAQPAPAPIGGRYAVQFEGAKHPAVALLTEDGDRTVRGTFLTVLGDYRYLSGQYQNGELVLSCFDGAHAFLFRARATGDDTLHGRFWSGGDEPQTWTAKRDAAAGLADPYQLTQAKRPRLDDLTFQDLGGRSQRLADPELRGRACVLLIFGSWCPNCHDATRTLTQLVERYGAQGLRVIGLAFELTDDAERTRRVLSAYQARHDVSWPILVAGRADKTQAGRALPFLSGVVAYPTAVFVDRDGTIRAVYTGFTGPAAGQEHQDLLTDWQTRIEDMLR